MKKQLRQSILPWLTWLSGLGDGLQAKRFPVRFPVRTNTGVGVMREATNGCFSLTSMFFFLSFSLTSPLFKNKYLLKNNKYCCKEQIIHFSSEKTEATLKDSDSTLLMLGY